MKEVTYENDRMLKSMECKPILSLLVLLCCSLQVLSGKESVIHNDTIWYDTSGNEIWCNGGHMIREGNTFYWVGYETKPRTGFRNIKLYSSINLADWKFENNILINQGPLAVRVPKQLRAQEDVPAHELSHDAAPGQPWCER